jgi:hypothetical protein
MNDVADGLLLDVREISITDLEFADSNSALSLDPLANSGSSFPA